MLRRALPAPWSPSRDGSPQPQPNFRPVALAESLLAFSTTQGLEASNPGDKATLIWNTPEAEHALQVLSSKLEPLSTLCGFNCFRHDGVAMRTRAIQPGTPACGRRCIWSAPNCAWPGCRQRRLV